MPTVAQIVERAEDSLQLHTLEKPGRNKGSRGQCVEKELGLENTNSLTDCADGDVKSFTLGQTIFITQLGHTLEEIIEGGVSFGMSKLGTKIANCCYIGYGKDGVLKGKYHISSTTHPEHYKQLEEDYNFICTKIKETYSEGGELKTTNGPNRLLQIRTKASKNKHGLYTPLEYKGKQLKNKYMAFYICSTFGKHLVSQSC